jgi:phage replication O-like protein O
MASPQAENGYTKIANEILNHVYKLKLNGTQFRIILLVWRYTYGFSRKEHELSEGFIAKAISINRKQVSRELKELIDCKIITVIRDSTHVSSRIIAFNKNYDMWELISGQGTNQETGSELAHRGGVEKVDRPGSFLDPQDNKVLKKDININHSAGAADANLFDEFWKAYPRKVAKAAAEKSFKKLKINDKLFSRLIIALGEQKQSEQWQDNQYIPYPATWLNQKRWEDELDEPEKVKIIDIGNGGFQLE